jgi:DNA-binding MarR family transcriptional regulator
MKPKTRVPPVPPGLRSTRRVRIASRLNSAAIRLLRRIAVDDGADGLSAARLSALSVLAFAGPQTLGSLARRERVSLPTMSRLADALRRDGLLSRAVDPRDRRAVCLAITEAGRARVERARARRVERLAGELAGISDADLRALESGLAVLEALGSASGDSSSFRTPQAVSRLGKRGRV